MAGWQRRAAAIALAIFSGARPAVAQTPTPAPTSPAAAPPNAAPPATATIRGRVVAADSGLPLRKADVHVSRADPPSGGIEASRGNQPRLVRTDADGKYELADVQPGRYNVNVNKAPYVSQNWGQRQPGLPSKLVEVHPGETLDRIDFSLQRGGVVTGRVVDEFGEPLAGVQMQVVQSRTVNGRRDLQESSYGNTDDLGEFRMFGIPPGQYYVKAIWRDTVMPVDPASPNRTGYADTFFPGTVNVDEAQRLTVRAGEAIADVSMSLSPVTTVRVHGSVVDASGKPLSGMNILVMTGDGRSGTSFGSSVRPDGTFTVGNLTAGEYTLRAQPMPPRKESAVMTVTVGTEDLEDVRLVAVPPSTISGRVVVDPAQAQSLPSALMLTLMPTDGHFFMGMQPSRVGDDLSFELPAGAGRYRINWMNLTPAWMIRSIRINNTDVTDEDLEVKPGENVSGVEIEFTNRSGTIAGSVTTTGGVASKDYRLIVFAADKKLWTPNTRYFRIGGPDQDGRFKVCGLPAGSYSVVALERGADTSVPFNDPEFLQRISPNADTVTVAEGETRTIELRLAQRP